MRRGGQKSIRIEFTGCATAFDMAASPCVRSIQQMPGTHEVQYKTRFGVSGYSQPPVLALSKHFDKPSLNLYIYGMKPIEFVGSSQEDLRNFPTERRRL